MTAQEHRQATRIIRNARNLERVLFELIAELQDAMHSDEPYDWASAKHELQQIAEGLPMLQDLVANIAREGRGQ